MVKGLVIHTSPTDKGRLHRHNQAPKAATAIWNGIGSMALNSPTEKALATLLLVNTHSDGLAIRWPMKRNERCRLSVSGWGM
ncbi:hypothetical protein GCM10017767_30770 [Halomonas urumqiensis]|nr:hypothetical protein GCM10017767_30770 [Halomonas urumqiensis]